MQLWFNFSYADGRFLSFSPSAFFSIWLSIYIIIYLIDGDCDNISGFISSVLSFPSYCFYSFTTKFTSSHLFLMSSLFSGSSFSFPLSWWNSKQKRFCGKLSLGTWMDGSIRFRLLVEVKFCDFNCNYRSLLSGNILGFTIFEWKLIHLVMNTLLRGDWAKISKSGYQ